jgi:ubiquinone/menaquinone biosynthesis C-methylase UbiE
MEGSYPGRLHLWDSSAATVLPSHSEWTDPVEAATRAEPAPSGPGEIAAQLFDFEALQPSSRLAREAEPYTLQWFLSIEQHRHGRHGRWIPRLLEFAKHAGETLLGLGHGLGTDWLQYARHGAAVVVCSSSASELALIRRNFELRGLGGRFVHAAPTCLPLDSASIDVACVSGLLETVRDPAAVVAEVFRVLKPGGKVVAVTPARYDIDFWCKTWFLWQRRRRQPVHEGAAVKFTARRLRRLFGQFVEHRIHKRQLRRSEVPHLWRVLPLPLLERLMGRALVLKAFKPLSVALPALAAA